MAAERPRLDIADLVAEHHQAVYRYAYRLSGSDADAEDLTQQVFLAAHQKLGQLQDPHKACNWLFAVLRNEFLKGEQKRKRLSQETGPYQIENIPVEVPSDEGIDREELQAAISELPPEYRVTLLMFYFEDLPYREIAEQLEVPIGTVMSRLARAKGALRRRLFGQDGRKSDRRMTPLAGRKG